MNEHLKHNSGDRVWDRYPQFERKTNCRVSIHTDGKNATLPSKEYYLKQLYVSDDGIDMAEVGTTVDGKEVRYHVPARDVVNNEGNED